MRKATAELILKDPDRFAHHDRVFLNNPVVMQGMGLAPLVVLATTAHNGVMLAAAVTLLLVPSRVLACLLSRLFPLNSENPAPEELQKKLLPRALVYSLSAAVVYLVAYPILNAVFGTSLLTLGIYLPLLVVEPLLTYRFGRVQETLHKAVSKGLRITVGYALLLMLLGCAGVELFAQPLAGLFSLSATTHAMCVDCMRIVSLGFWFAGLCIAFQGVFQALECGVESLVISLCRQVLFVLPPVWALTCLVTGPENVALVWWPLALGEAATLVVALVLYGKRARKRMEF